jgi:hypothetical protein
MLELIDRPQSADDLRRYFGSSPTIGHPYSGTWFEHLGRDDMAATRDIVTATDLIAVEMLSVRVPAVAAVDLLEGPLGRRLSLFLHEIPDDLDLGDERAVKHVEPGSPASLAWDLLDEQHGIGWVIAGKVLARKRPRLVPVYDDVVRCRCGSPESFWLWLHSRLRDDDGALQDCLVRTRYAAGVPETISTIRVFDVVLWMGHHEDHRRGRCRNTSTDVPTCAATDTEVQRDI